MYYYKIVGNSIMKHHVIIDYDKLNVLKEKIKNECSEIEHKIFECEEDGINNLNRQENIRNLQTKFLRTQDFNDIAYGQKDIYEVTYDEYTYPKLVYLIDDLLTGDMNAIDEIYNFEFNTADINQKINDLKEKINTIDIDTTKDIDLKISELEKLKSTINDKNYYDKQKKLYEYYKLVQETIYLEYLMSNSVTSIKNMLSFLNLEMPTNKMILKKVNKGCK